MDSGPFLTEQCGLSMAAALDLTRALDNIGLVKECNSLDGPAAWLADGGREEDPGLPQRPSPPGGCGTYRCTGSHV